MDIIFGLLLIITLIAHLYYLVRTLIVMGNHNILWAIGGFFINVFVHLIFYVSKKALLAPKERGFFKGYFLTVVAFIVLAVLSVIVLQA